MIVCEITHSFTPENITKVPTSRRDGLITTQLEFVPPPSTCYRVNEVYLSIRKNNVSALVRIEQAEAAVQILTQSPLPAVENLEPDTTVILFAAMPITEPENKKPPCFIRIAQRRKQSISG